MKYYKVKYQVQYEAIIEVDEDGEDKKEGYICMMDAISDLEIPEGGDNESEYVDESFVLLSVKDTEDPRKMELINMVSPEDKDSYVL